VPAALADAPSGFDDHVANLAGKAIASAHELSVGDDPATDARPQGHHDEVV
jgi:hypothetical protein